MFLVRYKNLWILFFALFIVVIAGTLLLLKEYYEKEFKHPKVFTAVFLSNEQVYFGHIVKETDQMLVLENVYYLRANAEITPMENSDETAVTTAKLSLMKLGDELHSPQDRMTINKDHILFWEEMKNRGVIMEAINRHEKAGN